MLARSLTTIISINEPAHSEYQDLQNIIKEGGASLKHATELLKAGALRARVCTKPTMENWMCKLITAQQTTPESIAAMYPIRTFFADPNDIFKEGDRAFVLLRAVLCHLYGLNPFVELFKASKHSLVIASRLLRCVQLYDAAAEFDIASLKVWALQAAREGLELTRCPGPTGCDEICWEIDLVF